MLKRAKGIKTTTYKAGFENFMIDIVETDELYEAYIYREDCGLRSMLYGVMKSDHSLRQFKAMIENGLLEDMADYDRDVADIEAMHTQMLMGEEA